MSDAYERLGGLAYFLPDLPDPPSEWFGMEIIDDEIEFALEIIGPVSKEMERAIYDLYSYYTANDSRTFVLFEYDYAEEEVSSFLVLPLEIFEKMWRFTSREFDVWNEVERKVWPNRGIERIPEHEIVETKADPKEGTVNEWAEGP